MHPVNKWGLPPESTTDYKRNYHHVNRGRVSSDFRDALQLLEITPAKTV